MDSFMQVFKAFRDAEDPVDVLADCLSLAAHLQESIDLTVQKVEEGGGAAALSPGVEESTSRISAADLEARMKVEKASLRERFDLELRNREQSAQDKFERELLEMQQSYEATIARKDAEVTGLLWSMKQMELSLGEGPSAATTFEMELSAEREKRRATEEKQRGTLSELAESQEKIQLLHTQLEGAKAMGKSTEAALRRREEEITEINKREKKQMSEITKRLAECESDLAHRPPVTFESLIEKIGVFGGNQSSSLHDLNERKGGLAWSELESFIVDSIRRMSSEAAESRVKEAEASKRHREALVQVNDLQRQLKSKTEIIQNLEREISETNVAYKARGGLKGGGGGERGQSSQSRHSNNLHDLDLEQQMAGGDGAGVVDAVGRGAGVGNDPIISALQGQRDRYLKLAKEREQEVHLMQTRLERAQEEQMNLKSDNVELYRRIRMLRAGSRGAISGGVSSATPSKARSRKGGLGSRSDSAGVLGMLKEDDTDLLGGADALDKKYTDLYEESIDPFKFEEMDKNAVIARMNLAEQCLAHTSRFFMQDRWSRHILLLYLIVVHMFAACYAARIVNPQIIGEFSSAVGSMGEINSREEVERIV